MSSFLAVDVGNARSKLGLFAGELGDALPCPQHTLHLTDEASECQRIGPWLQEAAIEAELTWWIGSVSRPAATRLVDWLREHRPSDRVTMLASGDLPIAVDLPRPDMAGVDRLLGAVAANRLRQANRPAVVIDVGTAITVDLVSAAGVFQGGAILPGIAMSARAMHEFTDLLPLLDMSELTSPPPALGTATEPAMRSGLFWGAVGAIRQLVDELVPDGQPEIFLTGGAGPAVAKLLGKEARHVPHLTLAGIALCVGQQP